MVFFTGCQMQAMTPGGILDIRTKGGTIITAAVGQWVTKDSEGRLGVVNEDQIAIDGGCPCELVCKKI